MPSVIAQSGKTSKHSRVIDEVRQRIFSGEWRPGERLPSFAEMRSDYGISPATIDRIYAVLEQEGLVVREQGRGIFVAQQNTKIKQIVGFMGPADISLRYSPYWAHLLEGIQEVAHKAHFEVLLLNSMVVPAWEKMDGVIAHGDGIDQILASRPAIMPAVSLMFPSTKVPSVLADDMTGTTEAVRHLVALGHRRIACLMLTETPLPQRRIAGYHTGLHEAGIKPRPEWVRSIRFPANSVSLHGLGRWNMAEWLSDGWKKTGCTALLVQNDRMAVGVLDALQEAKIGVPDEVSVIGFDGTEECEDSKPRLTSIEVPLHRLGASAMKILMSQIQGEEVETAATVLPVKLQLRETTAVAP